MLKRILIVLGLVLVTLGAVAAVKIGPGNIVGMIRYDQRREGDLRVGDPAPDVPLTTLEGTPIARWNDRSTGKPLVLVFGSFT